MAFPDNFTPDLVVDSPGRINLIGEHTDYNLGYVLPTAIEKKITFKFKKNNSDKQCNFFSLGFNKGFAVQLDEIAPGKVEWENYILGVLNEILKGTDKLKGFDCTIESKLPMGSGLSSSAALECGLAFGLNRLFGLSLSNLDIVKLSQRAEHTYVGTQCGIMDQFASVMSRQGHVIFLDCQSLEYQQIPIQFAPYKMIMLNTKVSHNLASSEYNTRKRECEAGVQIIKERYPEVNSLRDVDTAMIQEYENSMDPTLYRRCSFIVKENQRVLDAKEALRENDLKRFGELLYQAHEGISKNYEVSCPESDFLVDFSKKYGTVLGARQVGGGFGGCTLNLVHKDQADQFIKEAAAAYKEAFNIDLAAFEVKPSAGTTIR